MNSKQKLTAARSQLILDQPFFGTLALRLVPEVCAEDGFSMGSDGRKLYYNPSWVDSAPLDELKTVIAEEVMHIALCHHVRRGERDPNVWNRAADYAIYPILADSGFRVPAYSLHDRQYAGKAAEQIYSEIYQAPDPQNPGGNPQQGQGNKNRPGQVQDAPGDVDHAQEEQDQKVSMVQAQSAAKARGSMPAGLDRLVESIIHPKQDWKQLLRDFVERSAKNDYNWNRANARYLHTGFVLPTLISDELPPIVVAVDTSGSIDNVLLEEFAGELTGILETFRTRLDVIYVDSRVHNPESFGSEDLPVQLHPAGGGGTDFCPAFEWADARDEQPAALIYFTDMEGNFPAIEPAYPVLWIAYNQNRYSPVAPFGETVTVERN